MLFAVAYFGCLFGFVALVLALAVAQSRTLRSRKQRPPHTRAQLKTIMHGAALVVGLVVGLAVAFIVGCRAGMRLERTRVLSGPYRDEYPSALAEIAKAKSRLANGDSDVIRHLDRAQRHMEKVQAWTRRYLGQPVIAEGRR